MQIHHWQSLRTQLQLKVVRTAFGIGILVTLIAYASALHMAQNNARASLHQSLQALAYTAAIASFSNDQNLGNMTLKGVLSNPLVCSAHIRNLDRQLDLTLNNAAPSQSCRRGVAIWLNSPFLAGQHIGVFQADLYWPAIQHNAFITALYEIIGLVLLLFSATLASWRATNGLLTRPLLDLAQAVHSLRPGQAVQLAKPQPHQHNELGVLIDDINHLLETVVLTLDDERRLRDQMEALQQQYQSIFGKAKTGICLLDRDGHCTLANPSTARVLNLDHLHVEGPFCLYGNWIDSTFAEPNRFREFLNQAIETGQSMAMDYSLQQNSHQLIPRWVNLSISSHHTMPGNMLECVLIDISERKRVEEETRYQAEHDPLTQLHNRKSGMILLENTLCTGLNPGAILLIDLDRFKWINDHYGHQAGDQTLVHIAKKISTAARAADIVVRLGGDEFLLGLVDIGNTSNLNRIVRRILTEVSKPFELRPGIYEHVGASIGIALFPDASSDLVALMSHADIAMYRVKQAGRGGYCMYNGTEYSDIVFYPEKTDSALTEPVH